jgi:hypothetical protein
VEDVYFSVEIMCEFLGHAVVCYEVSECFDELFTFLFFIEMAVEVEFC